MLRFGLRFPYVVCFCLLGHIAAHFESIEINYGVVAHLHDALLVLHRARQRRAIVAVDLLAIFVEADLVYVQLLRIVQLL